MTGEPPKGWTSATLGEVVEADAPIIYGILQPGPDVAGGIPYVRPTEIVDGKIEVSSLRRTSPEIAQQYERASLKPGDVLLSIVGTIGKVAVVPEELMGANITQSSCRLRFNAEVMGNNFGAFFLKSPCALEQFSNSRLGTAVPRLNLVDVRQIRAPVPPLAEQERIVQKVRALFNRSGRARDELSRVPKLIERYRQAVLEAAFRGDLTADWRESRPELDTVECLKGVLADERWAAWRDADRARFTGKGKPWSESSARKRYSLPVPYENSADQELPATWAMVSLDELAWECSYGTSAKCGYEAKGIAVARIPNIARGALDLNDLKFASEEIEVRPGDELKPGDLVVVRTNGSRELVGRGAVIVSHPEMTTYFASYLIRFRLVGDDILRRWVSLLWHSPAIRNQVLSHAATSAGQYNVSMTELSSFAIPLAPLEEMRLVVDRAEAALMALSRMQQEYEKAAALLPRMEAAILDKAFSGELVPQDPNDEPASKLLERIKAAGVGASPLRRGRRPKAFA